MFLYSINFISTMSEKKVKSNLLWRLLKIEWKFLGKRRKWFLIYISFFFIAGLITLATPLVIGLIFNSIQKNGIASQSELYKLIGLISLLLAIDIGFWAFHGPGRVLEGRTGFFVSRNYKNDKIRKVLDLPMSWHKDHHSGDTIDKINNSTSAIEGFSQHTTFQVVYGLTNIIISTIILFIFSKLAGILALVFSVLTIGLILNFDKRLHKQYKELNKLGNKVSAAVYDYIGNITTVVTLRLKNPVKKEIHERQMNRLPLFKKSRLLNELKWGTASIAITTMTVIVLSFYALSEFNKNGTILIGTLYILYGYLDRVGNTFFRFAELYGRLVSYDASIANVSPIDEEFELVKKDSNTRLPKNWREIKVKNMSFTYNKKGKIAHLDKANLNLEKGKKIALIGESGSGKSTVLSLLRGLHSPMEGSIFVDGKKYLDGFSRLKHDITLIPQDPEIFNNSIKYNITLDFPTSKEELDKVIKLAEFQKVADRLEKGVNTNVMEKGVSLSGGEKQRLALARGILAAEKSSIVLMDEPTSSVDSMNEIKIYDNVFNEFKDKVVISSIHRLHLLNKFDYIYIFSKGKIIAEGDFKTLHHNPLFKSIWRKYMQSSRSESEKN